MLLVDGGILCPWSWELNSREEPSSCETLVTCDMQGNSELLALVPSTEVEHLEKRISKFLI